MTIEEWLFLISFLGLVAITAAKLFNLTHKGEKHSLIVSFLLFFGAVISKGLAFTIMMLNYENQLYLVLNLLVNGMFLLNVLLIFLEIIFYFARIPSNRSAFSSKDFWKQ